MKKTKTMALPSTDNNNKTPESKSGQSRTTTQVPSPEAISEIAEEDYQEEFSVSENTKGIDDNFAVKSNTWEPEILEDSRPSQLIHYGKINFGSAEKVKHDPSDIMNKAPQASENNTMGSVLKEYSGKNQDLVELYKEVYENDEEEGKDRPSQIYKHLKEINEEDSKGAASFSFGPGSREESNQEPIPISSNVGKITERTSFIYSQVIPDESSAKNPFENITEKASFIYSQVIPEEPAETTPVKEAKNPYESFAFMKKEKRSKEDAAALKRKYSEISSASTAAASMKSSQFGSKQTESPYALDKKKQRGSDEKRKGYDINQSQLIQYFSKKN